MRCRVFATVALAGTLASTCGAVAQTAPSTTPPGTSQTAPLTPTALDAFAAARLWLDQFDPPPMDDPRSAVPLENASGVCVILRRGGKTMGVAVDDAGDALMLRRALGRAMNQALADPALQSLAAVMREEKAPERIDLLRRDLGRTLTLEIEIAGPRTPLLGATLDQIAAKVDPGEEGVSLRNNQRWSHAFPAQQRITNVGQDASQTISALALDVGLALSDLADLGSQQSVGMYEFGTVNLLQLDPQAQPERIWRGERLVAATDLTRDRLALQTSGLVRHILAHFWPEPPAGQERLPLGLMGDYSPVNDRFQPMTAPAFEQALCAWALVNYGQSPSADAELAKDAVLAARRILRELAETAPGETVATDDLAACAAMLSLAAAMPSCLSDALVAESLVIARKRLEASFIPGQGFRTTDSGDGRPQPVNALTQALIAAAWVRLMSANVDLLPAPAQETIRAALDAIWLATPDAQQVALLPWIGLAETDFAAVTRQPLAHIAELQRLTQTLCQARISDTGAAEAPDLAGGLQLTGQTDSSGKPSAQTLRPAAWLAAALRVPELTGAESQAQAWEAHLQTMRFVCQLSMSDLRASTYRNPVRAAGGICASPWDSRQPLAAQAMGLLAIIETLQNWRN